MTLNREISHNDRQVHYLMYMCSADWQQDTVADLLFDTDVGLGMEIVRFNVGGSNTTQDALNSMRPFAAVPSVLLADGSYDWALVNVSGDDCASLQSEHLYA